MTHVGGNGSSGPGPSNNWFTSAASNRPNASTATANRFTSQARAERQAQGGTAQQRATRQRSHSRDTFTGAHAQRPTIDHAAHFRPGGDGLRAPAIKGARTRPQQVQTKAPTQSAPPEPKVGLLTRQAGMKVDSDGATNKADITDKHDHSDGTAFRWGKHKDPKTGKMVTESVDASNIPYIVATKQMRDAGVKMGDLARVTYKGNTAYAIVGDAGNVDTKTRNHGEGSVKLARMIVDRNASAANTSVSGGVQYDIMRGSGALHGLTPGTETKLTSDQIQALGRKVFGDETPLPPARPAEAPPRPPAADEPAEFPPVP